MKTLNLTSTGILAACLLPQLSTLCYQAHGAAGDVDLSFDAGSGVNGRVSGAALQPDGKLVIGGGFSMVKGLIRPGIARLNADGSGDISFVHPGPDSSIVDVGQVVLQADGKVLLVYASGITRLNSDGTFDETFTRPQTVDQNGFTVRVNWIAVQPDGKILISGRFTFVNNTNIQGLARLNSDGSLDPSFDPGFGLPPGFTAINSIVLQSDGKLLIGGRFPGFDVTYRPNLVRLNANGSVDDSFESGLSENGEVIALALQADGKVLVGGAFNIVHGTNHTGIARLNPDGSLDDSFDPSLGVGSSVSSLMLQSNGRVLIAGDFRTVNGTPRKHLARLNADGGLDASFDAFGNFGTGLAVQPDGKVIVATAVTFGTRTNYNILRLNTDGSRDTGFTAGGGPDGAVSSLAIQPDAKVVIGGFFYFIDGTATRGVARLHADGALDDSFMLDPAADGHFRLVALRPDGKLVVGGDSTFLNGVNTLHGGIARLNADGSLDSGFDPGTGVDGGQVSAIALQTDGRILIAGRFESVNGIPRLDLVRLNDDGSVDTSFNLNKASPGGIESVAVQSDGKILVGGMLRFPGDERSYALVRLNADGTRDGWFDFPRAGTVRSIVLQPDGKVLVAGRFHTPENEAFPDSIARLNTDGRIDNTFQPNFAYRPDPSDPGVVSAHTLILQPDGKVLVAGDYLVSSDGEGNDAYLQGVHRLNSNGSLDSSFSPGQGGRVNALGLQADGKVIAGGDGLGYPDFPRPYVALLHGDPLLLTPLNIEREGAFVILSWHSTAANFHLHETTDLSRPDSWSPVVQPAVTKGDQISVTVPMIAPQKFFRLASPQTIQGR